MGDTKIDYQLRYIAGEEGGNVQRAIAHKMDLLNCLFFPFLFFSANPRQATGTWWRRTGC